MDMTHRQMTKIAREVGRFTARTLRAGGVGTGEMDLLHIVRKRPGVTQAEVCRLLGQDQGAVARQTASLEAKGYLTRRQNPADGRSRLLFATPKAERLKHSKARVEALFYQWLLEGLEAEERQTFAALLERLYQRCKAESKAEFPEMTERVAEAKGYEE